MIEKLILGTVQFGLNYGINNTEGKPEKEKVFQILAYAYDNGIRFLDTAELYGNAHDLIGEFHNLHPTKKFNIITKFPNDFNENFNQKLDSYLNQLRVENLFAILFHSFDSYVNHKSDINNIGKLNLKNVRYLGVSVYTNDQIDEVIEDPNIDIIQIPFNLLDNINLRGKYLKKAKSRNKIIHTRSAFLQGLFFMNKSNKSSTRNKLEKELDIIKDISLKSSIPIGTLALNYCLCQNEIDGVLIGVDSLVQLIENISIVDNKIPDYYLSQINAIKIDNYENLNPSLWK